VLTATYLCVSSEYSYSTRCVCLFRGFLNLSDPCIFFLALKKHFNTSMHYTRVKTSVFFYSHAAREVSCHVTLLTKFLKHDLIFVLNLISCLAPYLSTLIVKIAYSTFQINITLDLFGTYLQHTD
jgi:hypothetical protein